MELLENVSETTGLGLGVHDDQSQGCPILFRDGQTKDIAACFDRNSSGHRRAEIRLGVNTTSMSGAGRRAAPEDLEIYPDEATGKYDYLGTQGQKIEWEMVPMGELFVEEGTIPGDDPHGLTGADGAIWHRAGLGRDRDRLCGGIVIRCRKEFRASRLRQFSKDCRIVNISAKIDDDHWEVTFDKIFSGPRDQVFARRPLPMHDEQSAGNNCGVLTQAIGPDQMAESPISRTRCGAGSIPTPSTWCSRSTLQLYLWCFIHRRRQAASW
jgi:hypothetical protein